MVTSCATSTRRSSIGLSMQSLVNQAHRGLQSPVLAEPGALAPGSECAKVVRIFWLPVAVLKSLQQSAFSTNKAPGHGAMSRTLGKYVR